VKNQQNNNTNNNNTNNQLILYPSNWIYNASVIGLLKVINENELDSSKFEQIEFKNGTIRIPKEWFFLSKNETIPYLTSLLIKKIVDDEDLKDWKEKKDKKGKTNKEKYKYLVDQYFPNSQEEGYRYIRARGKLFGTNTPFQNLVQSGEWEKFELFKLINETLEKYNENNLTCFFCNKNNINSASIKKEKSLEKRIIIFQNPHTKYLGPSIGEFPNSFWNNNSVLICPLCVYLFIHHIFGFIKIQEGEIFINAPDFELIWDLNQFVENILNKHKDYNTRKILGISLLQWAIKRRTLLSSWTMMNIELIIKKQNNINYFELPTNITKILLDYEIANLINDINEEKIFDLILAGKFSELEKATYFTLKAIIKLINQENINENDPIKQYIKKCDDLKHLKKIASKLPILYAKILNKLINREENMGETNFKNYYKENIDKLVESLKLEGSKVSSGVSEAINNIAYKLLEQVRLKNKDNVYYILLRCFYSNQEKFPDKLVSAFKPENDKYFKILIFSFLAPILSNTKNKQDKYQDNQDNENNQDSNEYL
jgi:CRISPR-associated protein Cst1